MGDLEEPLPSKIRHYVGESTDSLSTIDQSDRGTRRSTVPNSNNPCNFSTSANKLCDVSGEVWPSIGADILGYEG